MLRDLLGPDIPKQKMGRNPIDVGYLVWMGAYKGGRLKVRTPSQGALDKFWASLFASTGGDVLMKDTADAELQARPFTDKESLPLGSSSPTVSSEFCWRIPGSVSVP